MEGKIFDFSEFKRKKEEGETKKAGEKKPEATDLSNFMGMMAGMMNQVKEAGATDKSVDDTLAYIQLEISPNGTAINKVRRFVRPQSTPYQDAYERADKLSLEEIRGQIEEATEMLIKAHPNWYVVLMDNLKNRSKPK